MDYPRIIEAKVILDVPGRKRQFAEIILYCAGHITIEADSEEEDVYTASLPVFALLNKTNGRSLNSRSMIASSGNSGLTR